MQKRCKSLFLLKNSLKSAHQITLKSKIYLVVFKGVFSRLETLFSTPSVVFRALFLSMLMSAHAIPCDIFLKVGAGYKFNEPTYVTYAGQRLDIDFGSKVSARFELGCEQMIYSSDLLDVHLNGGYGHRSQWSTGYPFNSDGEYYVDELFVDLKIVF